MFTSCDQRQKKNSADQKFRYTWVSRGSHGGTKVDNKDNGVMGSMAKLTA